MSSGVVSNNQALQNCSNLLMKCEEFIDSCCVESWRKMIPSLVFSLFFIFNFFLNFVYDKYIRKLSDYSFFHDFHTLVCIIGLVSFHAC